MNKCTRFYAMINRIRFNNIKLEGTKSVFLQRIILFTNLLRLYHKCFRKLSMYNEGK